MRFFWITFSCLSIPLISFASDNQPFGARAFGMAYSSVTLSDEWSSFNNVAGLASIRHPYATIGYNNDFGLKSLNKTAVGIIFPAKFGVPAFHLFKYGNNDYSELSASLGYAHQISQVSLGLQLHYLQTSIDELGSKRSFVIEFGGIVEIIPEKLFFGATVYNINQAKSGEDHIPTTMKAGLSYRPDKKIMINIETNKDISFAANFRGGIEYSIIKNAQIRTGISSTPFMNFFGAGFNYKNCRLDYALSIQHPLGLSHQISFSFQFRKNK